MASFWLWAQANPLAAIALLSAGGSALGGLFIAIGKASPNITQLVRAMRGRNGNGHAHHRHDDTGALRKDFAALGTGDESVTRPELADLKRQVSGKGGLQERLAIVENTCARTETDVKALPEAFRKLLDAQTLDLKEWSRRHTASAFDAAGKETDAKIAATLKPKESGA